MTENLTRRNALVGGVAFVGLGALAGTASKNSASSTQASYTGRGNRTMYDGSPTASFPSSLEMVCGGPAWTQSDFERWPHAVHVQLDHTGAHPEWQVLDFEKSYVFDTATVVTWVKARLAIGPYYQTRPTVYAWIGNYSTLVTALTNAGLSGQWDYWAADQTGRQHSVSLSTYKNAVATQWLGGSPDISLVTDPTWCPDMRLGDYLS